MVTDTNLMAQAQDHMLRVQIEERLAYLEGRVAHFLRMERFAHTFEDAQAGLSAAIEYRRSADNYRDRVYELRRVLELSHRVADPHAGGIAQYQAESR